MKEDALRNVRHRAALRRADNEKSMQIKLTLEYDGTNYSGWQLQSGQDSIQGQLEAALEKILATPLRIHGSGRTDAGVHARAQVATFTLPRSFDPLELGRALNATLPPDIVILKAELVEDNFDPRRHAIARVYEYRILNQQAPSVFENRYSWLVRDPLDLDRMNEAASLFVGKHDFAAFRSLGSIVKTTVRHIASSEWHSEGTLLLYRVEANSFLRHMVRTMVATMAEIGRGKLPPRFIEELLERGERSMAPAAAPSRGLFLIEIRY
ncbi:MAG TPA: tRNA pseudouridine(38-40) synthase TruA [Candidatus Binataceae bacterium]|nr:tRNA pseudouridine(38-40) synthase TruA [Candidatus Binataceae bacterium]